MKLIWLTDIHIRSQGKTNFGYDPICRLETAIRYIEKHHLDADYCVLTGDLAQDADAASYKIIDRLMSQLPFPYLSIPGNHDNREVMRQQITLPNNTCTDFIQYSITKNNCRLIMLDTLIDGDGEGFLCERRLDWLKTELAGDQITTTYVFCHHHPNNLNFQILDEIRLVNGEVLLEVLSKANNVKHLFFGHVHQSVSGSFGNLGFTALQSSAFSSPLPYPKWSWDTFAPAKEPPQLGIIHMSPENVIVHFHQFCEAKDCQKQTDHI